VPRPPRPGSAQTTLRRRIAAIGVAAALSFALAACTSNDGLAAQYQQGTGANSKNYISGSGVTELGTNKRGKPVNFTGKTETGATVTASQYRGSVVVVNFWYAACGPCRIEAKDLEKISASYAGKGVQFLGVNTRDSADTVTAFNSQFKVTYPSILDVNGGAVQLAFSGDMRPNATPTTLVLDKEGRVAARIEGPINDQPSTLDTLISDTVAEKTSTGKN
jgi:peroxiredoxin